MGSAWVCLALCAAHLAPGITVPTCRLRYVHRRSAVAPGRIGMGELWHGGRLALRGGGNGRCQDSAADAVGAGAAATPATATEDLLAQWPAFVQHRLQVLERAKTRARQAVSATPAPIVITLPDGSLKEGSAGVTTPLMVAEEISKKLASGAVVALVDGELWDLSRPLSTSCALELLPFADSRAQQVFWHSSAHILGQALEIHRGALLVTGPATEDGFFYDVYIPPAASNVTAGAGVDVDMPLEGAGGRGEVISSEEVAAVEEVVANITRQKQVFERVELTRDEALDMFSYNPFKLAIIKDKVPEGGVCTAYRCGPLIDLCRGPHILHTGVAKAMSLTKNSAAYFKGNARNTVLQRVYGVSFPDNKALKQHQAWVREAKACDHRVIGREQQLFFFHQLSPGSAFFLPHGSRVLSLAPPPVACMRAGVHNSDA